jgi:hypothetical protein
MTTYNVTFVGDYWNLTTTHITDTKVPEAISAEASEFVRVETGFAPLAQANYVEVSEADAAAAEAAMPEHWVNPEKPNWALYEIFGDCADCGTGYIDEPLGSVRYCDVCFRCTVCEPILCE